MENERKFAVLYVSNHGDYLALDLDVLAASPEAAVRKAEAKGYVKQALGVGRHLRGGVPLKRVEPRPRVATDNLSVTELEELIS